MEREFNNAEKIMMRWLSRLFDLIVISVGVLAIAYVFYLVYLLALDIARGLDAQAILQEIVTILIFLEIFEILSLYFLHHHVNLRSVVEIGVLAIVKELLVTLNLQELGWENMLAIAALILVMGILYILEMKRMNAHEEFLIEHGVLPKKEEEE